MKVEPACLKEIVMKGDHPSPPLISNYKLACVSLLVTTGKEPCFLAILKSNTKGYPWRNQIALPGGHISQQDTTTQDTALRELEEELYITKDHIELVGSIGYFRTINNTVIKVFLGIWNGIKPSMYDSKEIAKVFKIPLKQIIQIHLQNHFNQSKPGLQDLVYPFEDVSIWGVTANILYHFIELITKNDICLH